MDLKLILIGPGLIAACATSTAPSTPPASTSPESKSPSSEQSQAQLSPPLRVFVHDVSGNGIEGADVFPAVYAVSETTPAEVQGSGAGLLDVAIGLPAGTEVELQVSAPGHVTVQTSAVLGGPQHSVLLRRGATVHFDLAMPNGGALPDEMNVVIRSQRDTQEVAAYKGRVLASGFASNSTTRGVGRIVVSVEGFVPITVEDATLEDEQVTRLGLLSLRRGAELRVLVVDADGVAIPGAGVVLETRMLENHSWFRQTDDQGFCSVAGLPKSHDIRVSASPPVSFGRGVSAETDSRTLSLPLAHQQETFVLYHPMQIRGRLIFAPGDDAAERLRAGQFPTIAATGLDGAVAWKESTGFTSTDASLPAQAALHSLSFSTWGRPGTYDLNLSVMSADNQGTIEVDLGRHEIPRAAPGARSGEFHLPDSQAHLMAPATIPGRR